GRDARPRDALVLAHPARGVLRRRAPDVAVALVPAHARWVGARADQSAVRAQRIRRVAVEPDLADHDGLLPVPAAGNRDRLASSARAPGGRGRRRHTHWLGVLRAVTADGSAAGRASGTGCAHAAPARSPTRVPGDRKG